MASLGVTSTTEDVGTPGAARPVDFNPRLAASSLTGFAYVGIAALATAIMTAAVLYALGRTVFGVWALITSIAAYMAVSDFGFSSAVPKFVGEFRATGDHAAMATFLGTAALVYGVVLLLATALMASLGIALPHVISLPVSHAEFLVSLSLMGAASGLTLIMAALVGVLHAWQHLPMANLVRAGYWASLCTVTVLLALAHARLAVFALAFAGTAFAACLAAGVTLRRALPHVRFGRPSWEMVYRSGSYSGYMFLIGIGAAVVFQTDSIVIGVGLGFATVAPYAAATRMTRALAILLHKIPDALFPFYSGLHAVGATERVRQGFALTARTELGGAAGLALLLIFAGPWLLEAWVGRSNVVAYPVLLLAIALMVCEAIIHPAVVVAGAVGGQRFMAHLNNLEAAGNLALSVALLRPLGLVGVITGSVVAQVLTNVWGMPRWAIRHLGMSWREYARTALVPALAPAIGCGAIGWGIQELGGATGRWLAPACAVGLYAISYALVNRRQPEVRVVTQWFRPSMAPS